MQVERSQPRLPAFDEDSAPSPLESAAEICDRVFQAVRPRTPVPQIHFEFCRFANANSFVRSHAGRLEFRVTDALQSAPPPVLEAVIFILICKVFRKPVPPEQRQVYNHYLNRQDVRRDLHLLRQARGRKHLSGPKGERYDLEEVFSALNGRFFNGLQAQPALGWSRRISRTILGHFDPSHNAIIISRLLDTPEAPRLALEYVMYHEMLHLRHPVEVVGSRRRIHSKAFREEEKRFPQWKEARAMLEKLCGTSRFSDAW